MTKTNKIISLAVSAGIVATIGGGALSAGAATPKENIAPIGWHMTTPMPTKAAAQKALDSYLPTIKAAGDWVTDSDVVLVKGGWKGETYYAGDKLLKGDVSATKGQDLPQLLGYHQVNGFKTKSDAQGHLNWALKQLALHPNDKQLEAGLVTTSTSSKGVKSYGYVVNYFTSGSKLFSEDHVIPYVEHDNHAGDNSD